MVWVDEGRSLTEIQQKRAAELFETEEERGEDGRLLHFWIKWVEKEVFYLSEQDDRQYTVAVSYTHLDVYKRQAGVSAAVEY